MQPVISTEQIREIDRLTVERYHTPSLLLMEAAATACLGAIQVRLGGTLENKTALVLCGKGNNGGDGAAIARGLSRLGVHCDVILFGKLADSIDDARINLEAVHQLAAFEAGSSASPAPLTFSECEEIAAWEQLARPRKTYDLIVDALFGTGLTRPLEGVFTHRRAAGAGHDKADHVAGGALRPRGPVPFRRPVHKSRDPPAQTTCD